MIKDFLTDVEKIVVETDADLLDEYEKARREYELEYLKKRQEAWLKISADSNPHP